MRSFAINIQCNISVLTTKNVGVVEMSINNSPVAQPSWMESENEIVNLIRKVCKPRHTHPYRIQSDEISVHSLVNKMNKPAVPASRRDSEPPKSPLFNVPVKTFHVLKAPRDEKHNCRIVAVHRCSINRFIRCVNSAG